MLLIMFLPALVKAQYCGNSGPAVCTPVYYEVDSNKVGSVNFDSLPCIERGAFYDESISFRLDSVPVRFSQLQWVSASSIDVDSIWNLPAGICWATNDSDNYITSGMMCWNFSGTTYAPAGAYKVGIYAFMDINVPITPEIDPWYFYLRVIEPGAPCQASVIYNHVSETEAALPELKLAGEKLFVSNIQPGAVVGIYDLAGRLLKQQTAQQAAEINVSEIHGMFLVNVLYLGNRYTQKFVR